MDMVMLGRVFVCEGGCLRAGFLDRQVVSSLPRWSAALKGTTSEYSMGGKNTLFLS